MVEAQDKMRIDETMQALGVAAQKASASLAAAGNDQRNSALHAAADELRHRQADVVAANAVDMRNAEARGLSTAMQDRLMLDAERVDAMAIALQSIAALPDPLGRVIAEWRQPSGLHIQRVSVPLGVIGIIYESRPNVTADAAGLCIKSGNAAILRGGSESFQSSLAIYECVRAGLKVAGIDDNAVQIVPTTDRSAVGYLLSSMADTIDVVVPRGGKSLIKRVQDEARVPVIGHLDGICHVYVHEKANTDMARDVVINAKMRRTGICGAAETVLIDRAAADRVLPTLLAALADAGCEVRGDETVMAANSAVIPAVEEDWSTEYLDAIVSIRVIDDINSAIEHIRTFGSGHTESIITDDASAAEKFLGEVDSAIVLHNASTQFADGGEFGMGAEIGIATGRIHARGPVGAEQLTSFKYVVRGTGQTRS
ncbi:MAG: glutamate-5-semialdehyde dehydrogenase [Gammaproteobacteria bacterium]|nr:glutamate-5-semialdehyde dehydrogenase [Gammaproteobacteria bacterium]